MRIVGICLMLLALAACGGLPKSTPSDTVKIGKPYVIDGKEYIPSAQPDYDEIGMASWYGPGFHGKSTASGEKFNENDMTAAHATLPLPSLVRVTNLRNGKSTIVRVNDRGPFSKSRIIDLSKSAAKEIGLKELGVAQVRVQYLRRETEEYVANLAPDKKERNLALLRGEGAPGWEGNRKGAAAVAPVSTVQAAPLGGIEVSDAQPPLTRATPAISPVAAPAPRPLMMAAKENEAPVDAEIAEDMGIAPLPQLQPQAQAIAARPAAVSNRASPLRNVLVADAEASERPKASSPDVAVAHGSVVQAGSFGSRANAEKRVQQLVAAGAFRISEIALEGKPLYRVRSEPAGNHAEAEALLEKVRAAGIDDATLIRQ